MNLFIRITLLIVGISLLILNMFDWWEFRVMSDMDIRGRRSSFFVILFSSARYLIMPALCVAAANFIGGRPFLPGDLARKALYFLALFLFLDAGWEFVTGFSDMAEIGSLDSRSMLYLLKVVLWPITMSTLALFFAQQFIPDNRDRFDQD